MFATGDFSSDTGRIQAATTGQVFSWLYSAVEKMMSFKGREPHL